MRTTRARQVKVTAGGASPQRCPFVSSVPGGEGHDTPAGSVWNEPVPGVTQEEITTWTKPPSRSLQSYHHFFSKTCPPNSVRSANSASSGTGPHGFQNDRNSPLHFTGARDGGRGVGKSPGRYGVPPSRQPAPRGSVLTARGAGPPPVRSRLCARELHPATAPWTTRCFCGAASRPHASTWLQVPS